MPHDPPPQGADWRPAQNYLAEAFLTLVLYYLGVGVSGFVANIYFLRRAQREQADGIPTRNVGCLHALLWTHIVLFTVVGMALLITFLRQGA